MISRRRMLAAKMHLPLRQLALCLDCDECFKIGCPTCPACGSATWTSLSRFLAQSKSARYPGRRDAAAKRPDDPPEVVRQLIIVAGDRAHLYEHLKRGFAGNGTVRVLLNRRVMARRARYGPYEAERRQADRRLPSKVDAYCARLAGPSWPWMSLRIIIETPPSSDHWMVAKTNSQAATAAAGGQSFLTDNQEVVAV
jgi:hypothetical protein